MRHLICIVSACLFLVSATFAEEFPDGKGPIGPPLIGPDGEVLDAIDLTDPAATQTSAWYTPMISNWSGSVELGLGGTQGNTDTFNIRAGGKLKHVIEDWQTVDMSVIHIDKNQNGQKIAQNTLFEGRIENQYKPTHWTTYAHGLLEQDAFKAFDWRLAMDAGVGFQWIDNDRTTFVTRFGGGTSREFGGPDDVWKPELVFGAELSHQLTERQKFNIKSEYFPNVADFSDFRLNSSADWEMLLAKEWDLSLKIGVIDRYDSTPGNQRPNDLTYSTLMLYGF